MSVDSAANAAVAEILQFLTLTSPVPPKVAALEYFLGLSNSPEGVSLIVSSNDGRVISSILVLTFADKSAPVVENCLKILINLTVDDDVSWALLNLTNSADLPKRLLRVVVDRKHVFADQVCGILCNLTRSTRCSLRMAEVIAEESAEEGDGDGGCVSMHNLVLALTTEKYNEFATLHYLAPFISNLTQVKSVRNFVMDEKRCVIQRLLPFMNYEKSPERRGGVIGILRNCCFDVERHEWLLMGDDVDLLPRLLLPLTGPEEFDDEDNEKLPEDLQYLPEDKSREPDPDLRKMLVETIFKLCTTKKCRRYIREKNAYVIMRELHKWEKDRNVELAVMKLVDLLIGDDDGKDLDRVEIDEHTKATFEKQDREDEKWVEEGEEEEAVPALL